MSLKSGKISFKSLPGFVGLLNNPGLPLGAGCVSPVVSISAESAGTSVNLPVCLSVTIITGLLVATS